MGLSEPHPLNTPIELNHKLCATNSEPLANRTRYQEVVGSLVYLALVHLVNQFSSAPRTTHRTVVV